MSNLVLRLHGKVQALVGMKCFFIVAESDDNKNTEAGY
jgi:hypothetical protein